MDKDYFKGFKDMLEGRFKKRFKTLIDIYPVSNDTYRGTILMPCPRQQRCR